MNKELENIAHFMQVRIQRKKRQKLIIRHLCIDYTKNSTLHGLRYTTASELTLIEKVFWLATFLASVGLCGYQIGNVYHKWTTSPVIVTVSEKLVSVENMPFPSVTICPQIKSKTNNYNFGKMINDFKDKNLRSIFLDEDKLKDISLICNYNMKDLSNRNITNATLLKHIKSVSPSIKYTFQKCYWQRVESSCSDLFAEVYTDEGICFNMNGVAANEMFRDTVQSDYNYSSRYLQSRGWSLDRGYFDSETDPFPKRGNKNHASPDLEIILKSKDADRDPKCNGLKSGYDIFLHHPADYPQTSLYRYSAQNDEVTSLAVSVHVENTSQHLADYSPEVRQCYFLQDRYLRYFQNYTAKNCEAECISNYTYKRCGCVGFYMPHDNSSELCAENKMACMKEAYNVMARREPRLQPGEEGCRCWPSCQNIEYDAEVLKTNFGTANYEGKSVRLFSFLGFTTDGSIKFSKVEIYFKKPKFLFTRRSELFGTTDFLANIGGLLGLFLGFSFLSLVEIIYFITLRLWLALWRDIKDEKKRQMNDGDKKYRITKQDKKKLKY